MMNSIDDMFKTKWEYTTVGRQVVSIDSNGNLYYYDAINGELKNKKIEVLSENIIYCKDTNKYYNQVNGYWIGEGFFINGTIENIVDNGFNRAEITIITDDGRIALINENGEVEVYIDDVCPELKNIKFKSIKYIPNGGTLLTSRDNIQYIVDYDEVAKVEEFFPNMKGKLIKEVLGVNDNGEWYALTDDGKLVIFNFNELYTLPFEKEINNIDNNVIETKDKEYYVIIGDYKENPQINKINDIFLELKDKEITTVDNGFILTNEGDVYFLNEDNKLENEKMLKKDLQNRKVIDCKSNEEEECFLTDDGNLFIYDGNDLVYNYENIQEINYSNGVVIIKNKNGYEGYLDSGSQNIEYPNITNIERKTQLNFKDVKNIAFDSSIGYLILIENGSLYNMNNERLNDKYYNGKK